MQFIKLSLFTKWNDLSKKKELQIVSNKSEHHLKGLKNGRIYYQGKFIEDSVLIYDDEIKDIIAEDSLEGWLKANKLTVTKEDIQWLDAKGGFVVPGFIDVHIHGYMGHDVMDSDEDGLKAISKGIAANGVTSFLPTTMTMHMSKIEEALQTVKKVMSEGTEGAQILGVHMEGPFINEDFKGAQPKDAIIAPDANLVKRHEDILKVITIAPEVNGAMELIEAYKDKINFSLGHTGADYETAMEAIDKGACCVTHLFSAMTGLHHRKPGVVGAAFNSDCYSELIADKIHVNEQLFELVTKVVGLDKLMLITDCMQGGGLPEGEYDLGGQNVWVKDGKCTLESGTIAGSVLTLNKGLQNLSENVSHQLETLIPIVTLNQATYLGLDHKIGTLDKGKEADIVVMDEHCQIKRTIVKGSSVYEV